MMKKLSSLLGPTLDFLWVLQAFLRGKVLCQKDYMPKDNCFRLSTATTFSRMKMLMSWWGFRPATIKELTALMAEAKVSANNDRIFDSPEPSFWFGPAYMRPYLHWENDAWHWRYSCGLLDYNSLTLPPRKF